ncbi:MAG: ankyrin repeat domain-containing protein [Chlamydiales bacterium]|nr:ankyrin repeat domain-containing protein [Chlamydiales bacterium]
MIQHQSEEQIRERLSGDSKSVSVFLEALSDKTWCQQHADLCLKVIKAIPNESTNTPEGKKFLSILTTAKIVEHHEPLIVQSFALACQEKDFVAARALLQLGLSPLGKDAYGDTPFHHACGSGDLKLVTEILTSIQSGRWNLVGKARNWWSNPVNIPGSHKQTPLHFACRNGNPEVVRLLLDNGAKVAAKTDEDATPLHDACQSGVVETVKELIARGADITIKGRWAGTPLQCACSQGHGDIVKLLIQNGASVSSEPKSKSPLHIACERGNVGVMKPLLKAGADVHATDLSGNTPLHLACLYNRPELVEQLVKYGARSDVLNLGKSSPLHTAARSGEVPLLKLLLEAGALEIKDKEGNTPLQIACRQGNSEAVRELLHAGALADARNAEEETPLHIAVAKGDLPTTAQLVESKADTEAITKSFGDTPLIIAARKGQLEMIEYLKTKVKVDATNATGETALSIASGNHNVRIVKELLSVNANPDLGDPLKAACTSDDSAIFSALLEAGADLEALNIEDSLLQMACRKAGPSIINAILDKQPYRSALDPAGNTAYTTALANTKLAGDPVIERLKLQDDGTSQELIFRKLLAHRFSLKGVVNLGEKQFPREAWSFPQAKIALEDSVTAFYKDLQDPNSEKWQGIVRSLTDDTLRSLIVLGKEELNTVLDLVKEAIQHSIDPIKEEKDATIAAKRIADGKPTAVLTDWLGHCVALVFFGDKVSRCNKGTDKEPGIHCHTIGKKENIPHALMRVAPVMAQHYFKTGIDSDLELKPSIYLAQKQQKTGNCTIANSNGMEYALLYMVLEDKIGPKAAKELALAIKKMRCEDSKNGSLQEYLDLHLQSKPKWPPDWDLLKDIYNKKTADPDDDRQRKILLDDFATTYMAQKPTNT